MRAKNQTDYIRRMMADDRDHSVAELAARLCTEATPEELIYEFRVYWRTKCKNQENCEPSFRDIDLFAQKYKGAKRMVTSRVSTLLHRNREIVDVLDGSLRLLRLTRKGQAKCKALNNGNVSVPLRGSRKAAERYKE